MQFIKRGLHFEKNNADTLDQCHLHKAHQTVQTTWKGLWSKIDELK